MLLDEGHSSKSGTKTVVLPLAIEHRSFIIFNFVRLYTDLNVKKMSWQVIFLCLYTSL